METEKALQALSTLIDNDEENQQCGLRFAYSQIVNKTQIWQWVQSGSILPENEESVANYALYALIKHSINGISVSHHYAECMGSAYAIHPTAEIISATNPETRLSLFTTMPYFISPTEIKYLNNKGKTASAKIGKALAKILPALSEKERHQLADLLKRECAPKPPTPFLLAPADNPDLWAAIYRQAARQYNLTSCMTEYEGIRAIRGYACAHLLPNDKRAEQMNYALAYLVDNNGTPYSRAIVNTKTKEFITTYSAYLGEMEKSLVAAGYRHNQQALDGMYIYAGVDNEYAPYVDGHHCADEVFFGDGRFWLITESGDYTLDSTSGYAPDIGAQCSYCDEHSHTVYSVRDYLRHAGVFAETYVCESCRDNNFTFVPSEGEYYPNDWVKTDNRGNTIVAHPNFLDNHVIIDDEYYHIHDVVYSDYHDGYIAEKNAIYIDFIGDYVAEWEIKRASGDYYNFFSDWLNQKAIEHGQHISQM